MAKVQILSVTRGVVENGKFRPVEHITDRAKRYRAQHNVSGPKRCYLCGNPKPRDVGHIDGNEGNGEPATKKKTATKKKKRPRTRGLAFHGRDWANK